MQKQKLNQHHNWYVMLIIITFINLTFFFSINCVIIILCFFMKYNCISDMQLIYGSLLLSGILDNKHFYRQLKKVFIALFYCILSIEEKKTDFFVFNLYSNTRHEFVEIRRSIPKNFLLNSGKYFILN